MARKAKDIFQEMGIEGGVEAVTHAAAMFIQRHPFSQIPTSTRDLSEHELNILEQGGFPPLPECVSSSENMTTVAGEIGVMIAGSLSQAQAAQLMGVDPSRVRQRISQRTLYAILGDDNVKVLPRFQFTDKGALPGLEKILPVINDEAHPIAIQRFFLTASPDLYSDEAKTNLSPRDWLITRHSPEPIIRMAADL